MNKIYKVIWSKVRNCYVAVSEIAKRNGKSCTSVNCGAKASRRCVGVALALALSLSLAGGGVTWAVDVPNETYTNPIEIDSPVEKGFDITASNETLATFNVGASKSYGPIAFTDTITGKNVIFAGTHTDTLTQNTAKTKLIYTVGDKNVSTATLNGAITWSDGGVHYTNGSDVNQNGVAASYKFDGNSAVDVSGVSFSATTDPLNKSMTLLKGVNGVAANKVSGTPSFVVALDQTNTKLDAKATGAATVSGNEVTYSVSGVAIDKVNPDARNGLA